MKSKKEAIDSFTRWYENNTVGMLTFYHAPNASEVDCIIERVIKAREMKPEVRAAFEFLMDELQIERGEMHRNANGKPDRIKLTRRFDG
jgi:hypothetical protein